MSIQLPPKPWKDGDTFTNDSTGVEYTYDGVKWIASGGGEADEATLDFINEVDRTSQMRDEAIEQQHKQDEALNTAAHLRMEQQIVRIGTWSEADDDKVREEFAKADSELQAQIDAIESPEGKYLPLSGGEMTGPAVLKVNHLEPVNTPMIQYNGDPDSTHAAGLISRYMMTKYVKEELDKISFGSPELPRFKLMGGTFENFKAGEFAMLDNDGEHTRKIEDTRCIAFSSVDIDGKRWARNRDAIEYGRTFNTNVSVLLDSGDKTVFSMSPFQTSGNLCQLYYLPEYEGTEYDLFMIYWAGVKSHAVTSDTTVWNVGSTYQLYIPEIFY
jgi:hypothetical protein